MTQSSSSTDNVSPEDARLSTSKTVAYGIQHILTMYCGIIAPPLIIGPAAHLTQVHTASLVTAALFVSGLATLLQSLGIWRIGARLPLVQGVSFTGVATMLSLLSGGCSLPVILGAIIVSSVLGFFIAPCFAQIVRLFPPVVSGSVVTVIGLSLVPVAISWLMGGTGDGAGSISNIGLGMLTLVIILLIQRFAPSVMRPLAVLLGMVCGYLVAWSCGMVTFVAGEEQWVALPSLFAFGLPQFDINAILSMLLIMVVLLAETTAGLLAAGEVVGTRIDASRIANGLRADMLSSALSPIFGAFSQSVFIQNIGLIAMTGVKSRFVVATGGGLLVILGLLPVLGQVAASIPLPVLGGGGVLLFGTVAASGIRTLGRVDYERNNMNLVIVAAALVMGLIPVMMPAFYDHFPEWVRVLMRSSIGTSCLVAVILNILFNGISRESAAE